MLRVILRKVQGGLIISAALLVVLAFQRLHSYDVPVFVGHASHHEHADDDAAEGVGSELVGHGHAHGRHRIFATNVIEIGLFRFVVPFRWTSSAPEDNEAAAARKKEPKWDGLLPPPKGGRGGPRGARAELIRHRRPREAAAARPANGTRPTTSAFDGRRPTKGSTTIAYAVPIASCPSDDLLLSQGLAVLGRSVRRYATAKYGHKIYALVHPDAEGCTRNTLEGLGYEVVVARVQHDGDDKRAKTSENKEDVTSLFAYGLLDHPIAVQLDPRSLVMSPLDRLFDAMLEGPDSESRKDLPVSAGAGDGSDSVGEGKFPNRIDAFLTREAMVGGGGMVVRRGFRVVRTGRGRFEELSLLVDGRNETSAAFPGNVTVRQSRPSPASPPGIGLYSLYYDHLHPRTAVDLDPCAFGADGGRGGPCTIPDPDKTVRVASLASCPEPWSCTAKYAADDAGRFCENLHRTWFELRKELGPLPTSDEGGHNRETFIGYCKSDGYPGYVKYVPDVASLTAAKLKRWLFRRHV